MSMTLRERVLNLINMQAPGFSLTNRELATALGAPIPSVRRATLELETAGQIRTEIAVDGNAPLRWEGYAQAHAEPTFGENHCD